MTHLNTYKEGCATVSLFPRFKLTYFRFVEFGAHPDTKYRLIMTNVSNVDPTVY